MIPGLDERFTKHFRIRKRSEYLEVQRWGHKVHSRAFIGLIRIREEGNSRIGIVTTKRLGNAVVRNRTKRLVREAFRRGWMRIPQCADVVVIAKNPASQIDSKAIFEDLALLGRRVTRVVEQHQ